MRIFLMGLVILVGLLAGFYVYMGGLYTVKVRQASFGPAEFAYAVHKGPYAKLSEAWGKFMPKWQAAGLKTCSAIGVYLDPPTTPDDKLRSLIGCRIDEWSEADKAAVRAKFATLIIPQSQAWTSEFPFRNFLSFFYGPMRVYPEIQKAIGDKGERSIGYELYGPFDNITSIRYVVPINEDGEAYRGLYAAADQP